MNGYEAHYDRDPGVYHYSTEGGMPVYALALPTWEELEQSLGELSPMNGYVVTPELITLPVAVEEIDGMAREIEDRIAKTIELSQLHPDATILLGTPTIDEAGVIRNSLAIVSRGELVGYIDKRGIAWEEEARVFSRSPRSQASLEAGYAALICSDIITAAACGRFTKAQTDSRNLLGAEAKTLVVSSCWAVPRYEDLFVSATDERRYSEALERSVSDLFMAYPELQEVIMVDRATTDSSVLPYTGHFKRTQSGEG